MNVQYKYFEKTLTRNMARELIQELFSGRLFKNRK